MKFISFAKSSIAGLTAISLFDPLLPAQATTITTFLIQKNGSHSVYLGHSNSKVLQGIPDPATATKFGGANWVAHLRHVSPYVFSHYTLGKNLVSVISPTPIPVSTNLPTIGGCTIFPAYNAWNQDISKLPVSALSDTYINSISATKTLHPDFGQDLSYGIPFNVVSASQPMVPITFTAYGDESDAGPYPMPANPLQEDGGDGHVLVLQSGSCKLYELYNAGKNSNNAGWHTDSGAVWNLNTGALRPAGWTSADAAGLPILPGLVRYDEVAAGAINHAIRFTAPKTQNGWILPATHQAGSNNANLPPMGLRVRLKANYDTSKLTGQALVIATAMKKYGLILADNGSSWFFQGASDARWNDDQLNQLKQIPGSAFEAVNTGPIIKE